MSIFEEWAKPFPKIQPVSYRITDNPYWDNLLLMCPDPVQYDKWVICYPHRQEYFSKVTLRFQSMRNSPLDFSTDFVFPSVHMAGDFYQQHIETINRLHHSHPEYEPIRIAFAKRGD